MGDLKEGGKLLIWKLVCKNILLYIMMGDLMEGYLLFHSQFVDRILLIMHGVICMVSSAWLHLSFRA